MEQHFVPPVSILMEQHFDPQIPVVMDQHFVFQLSILMKQDFVFELPNHCHVSSICTTPRSNTKKKVTAVATIAFVVVTPSPKKTMAHYHQFLPLKHRKKMIGHCHFRCNITKEENDDALPSPSSIQTQR
jgi:hypothetical protein